MSGVSMILLILSLPVMAWVMWKLVDKLLDWIGSNQ